MALFDARRSRRATLSRSVKSETLPEHLLLLFYSNVSVFFWERRGHGANAALVFTPPQTQEGRGEKHTRSGATALLRAQDRWKSK